MPSSCALDSPIRRVVVVRVAARRWLRVFPLLLLVMVAMTWFDLGDRDNCRWGAWRSLLFVDNLWDVDRACFGVTWSLSVEMQACRVLFWDMPAQCTTPYLQRAAV